MENDKFKRHGSGHLADTADAAVKSGKSAIQGAKSKRRFPGSGIAAGKTLKKLRDTYNREKAALKKAAKAQGRKNDAKYGKRKYVDKSGPKTYTHPPLNINVGKYQRK